ncbi:MAG: SMP-30/gluconolactonase/LRE family protein [Saprospiraceae bacterium]|jgi:sugar lactone lactonase YvrE|nr:SMP-30/gluconolactonase/LRE family protein [Saprospiraceae bacterium]
MKNITLILIGLAILACNTKRFTATDLTPDNSFSSNCEGPNVDKAGNLYVVNYQKDGTVGIVTPDGKASVFVELPVGSTANAIRFDSKGDMLLADFTGHNVLKINPSTKNVSVFCHDDRFNQPNDLCITKCDVVFASDPKWADGTGQVWRIMPDGKATLAAGNMGTTNGIELSPDDQTLYVNESAQLNVWAFNVSLTGELSNKRLFHKFTDHGMDGMKCDRQGNLYVTRYGKGVVAVLSPQGKLLREIPLKGKKTSNIAFGGPDGKTAYVTLQDRKCVETFRNKVAGKGW